MLFVEKFSGEWIFKEVNGVVFGVWDAGIVFILGEKFSRRRFRGGGPALIGRDLGGTDTNDEVGVPVFEWIGIW